jgi:hypothetical protein
MHSTREHTVSTSTQKLVTIYEDEQLVVVDVPNKNRPFGHVGLNITAANQSPSENVKKAVCI